MNVQDALAFLTVARLKSFSRAAAQMNVAQSALSRRVQRLEQDTGHTLLKRLPKGVDLTRVGKIFYEKVERLQTEIELIQREMLELRLDGAETLRLAIPHGAMRLIGPPLVQQIRSRNPQAQVHVFERESIVNRESVLSGEIDIGLAYNPEPSADLEITPLLIERLYVVGPAKRDGKPVLYPTSFSAPEVALLPLILPGPQHGYRKALVRGLRGSGLAPNVALEVHGLSAVASFVQRGAGFALTTYAAMQQLIDDGELAPIPVDSARFNVKLCMTQKRSPEHRSRVEFLRQAVFETLASIEQLPPSCRRC